jgi:hypothetical protein
VLENGACAAPSRPLWRAAECKHLNTRARKIIRELFQAFAEKPLLLVGSAALDPFDSGASQILSRAENEMHWTEMNGIE